MSSKVLISDIDVKRYQLMQNVEKQCDVEASWTRFKRDVQALETSTAAGSKSLVSMEDRLRKLQNDLRFTGGFAVYATGTPFPVESRGADSNTVEPILEEESKCEQHLEPCPSASDESTDIDVGSVPEGQEPTIRSQSCDKDTGSNGLGVDSLCLEPEHYLKLKQFRYRISAIERDIVDDEQKIVTLSERRAFLALQLVRAQERILTLNSEVDRVVLFKGRDIISSVLHGSDQRFSLNELKRALQKELLRVKEDISKWKAEIIEDDETSEQLRLGFSSKKQRVLERKAALKAFERQLIIANRLRRDLEKRGETISANKNDDLVLGECFRGWLDIKRRSFHRCRLLASILSRTLTTYAFALQQWHSVMRLLRGTRNKINQDEDLNHIVTAGDAVLRDAVKERRSNARRAVSVMKTVLDPNNDSSFRNCSQHVFLTEVDESLFFKATLHYKSEQFQQSFNCYEHLLERLSSDDESYLNIPRENFAALYSFIYGRMSLIQLRLQPDSGLCILYAERQLQIAQEFDLTSDKVEALVCFGECYYTKKQQAAASTYFEQALEMIRCGDNDNNNGDAALSKLTAKAHLGLEKCYKDLGMANKSLQSRLEADTITHGRDLQISEAKEKMDLLKNRLVNVTAESAEVIPLQRVTNQYVRLKQKKRNVQQNILSTQEGIADIDTHAKELNGLLQRIKYQLKEAQSTEAKKMISSLVHENTQEFDTKELIFRLEIRQKEVQAEIYENRTKRKRLLTHIKNQGDDLKSIMEDLELEQRPLMQKVLENRILRCIALSASNEAGNDVLGGATGGVDFVAVSEGKDIYVHKLRSGKIKHVFQGDEEGKHVGEIAGHTSFITCLYFFGTCVYSGSMDSCVMCWDAEEGRRVFVARGHEATITCINVDDDKMVTGSADMTVGVWNRNNGELLQRVNGHARGILSLQSGPSWCVSSDSDGVVCVWDDKFECKKRLRSTKTCARITVARYGALEVVTGDSNGCISMWWIKTGQMLKSCNAHDGSVVDLQFDATRVVSCGYDGTVQVVDILTGDVLQTLRGHNGPVLAVSFDSRSILSASRDGTIRRWAWGDLSSRFQEKIHTYAVGETLPDICKKYDIGLEELCQWNGIRGAKSLYAGKKLIVRKGDPTKQTKAEILAERNSQKLQLREARMMKIYRPDAAADRKDTRGDDGIPSKTDENQQRNPCDDPSTLGNRLRDMKRRALQTGAVSQVKKTDAVTGTVNAANTSRSDNRRGGASLSERLHR